MNKPAISIVTPSYNQAEFLGQTIDSVLSQGYANLQYIIIDGGSTDGSVEIIKKHSRHLDYWISEPDNGQSDAINKGLKLATGEVFNWLNSDDYYSEDALLSVGDAFMDENTHVFTGRSRIFSDHQSHFSSGTDIYPNNLAKTIGCARIDQPETFFRKSCIEQVGGINPALHYIMDRDLWIRYLFQFGLDNIKISDQVLVNFRLHERSKTQSSKPLFNKEHDSYFYTLAKQCGFSEIAETIASVCASTQLDVSCTKCKVLESALQYYMFQLGEEFYRRNEKEAAETILNCIDKHSLDKLTAREFKKIKFRNQYLPLWVIGLFRRP